MSDPSSGNRPSLRQEWIRYRRTSAPLHQARLRAGLTEGGLPDVRLDVPHEPQSQVSRSVPQCVSMVMHYFGRAADAENLALLLRTDDLSGTPGQRLEWLRAWGWRLDFPRELQFFRDGTLDLNQQLGLGSCASIALVYRWERPWVRYLTRALEAGVPPILFVDLGRLYPHWEGLRQPHAVVLAGGEGRRAWIQDPARREGPVRVPLAALMDALLPDEPLAAVLRPDCFPVDPAS